MMNQLNLNGIERLVDEMYRIVVELQHAKADAYHAANAVGHDGLAETIRDFAREWKGTREDVIKSSTKVHNTLLSIDETFGKVDSLLASALRDQDEFKRQIDKLRG